MAEKLYDTHSIQYSAQRDTTNTPIGTASFSFWSDVPRPSGIYATIEIGDELDDMLWLPRSIQPHPSIYESFDFIAPPKLHVTAINVDDEVICELEGSVYRQYKITVEGYLVENNYDDTSPIITNYSVNAEETDTGDTSFTASVTTINGGDIPTLFVDISDSLEIPNIPVPLVCNSYKFTDGTDEFKRKIWTVTYECSAIVPADTSSSITLPQEEQPDISYELNGTTARSVSGEFIVLRRSETPITKKTVIVYSQTVDPVYSIGSECYGGIAISDKVTKETKEILQLDDNTGTSSITTFAYYRHEIEVES